MKLVLKKAWAWLKNYWYWPVLLTMLIVFSLSKSSLRSKIWALLEEQRQNYKEEISLINKTQEDLSSRKEEIVAENKKRLDTLDEEHEVKVKEIKKEKNKEVTVLIEEYEENPDELAKRVAAALSAEYLKTEWEKKK